MRHKRIAFRLAEMIVADAIKSPAVIGDGGHVASGSYNDGTIRLELEDGTEIDLAIRVTPPRKWWPLRLDRDDQQT